MSNALVLSSLSKPKLEEILQAMDFLYDFSEKTLKESKKSPIQYEKKKKNKWSSTFSVYISITNDIDLVLSAEVGDNHDFQPNVVAYDFGFITASLFLTPSLSTFDGTITFAIPLTDQRQIECKRKKVVEAFYESLSSEFLKRKK